MRTTTKNKVKTVQATKNAEPDRKTIFVYASEAEKHQLEAAAKAEKRSLSSFLLMAGLDKLKAQRV